MDEADQSWSNLGVVAKAALVAIGPFVSVGLFSMGAALPRLAADFSGAPGSTLLIPVIGAVVAPVFAVASPLAGKLIGRFGIRNVYVGSVLLMAIGGAGPALCSNLAAIVVLRVLLALGVAGGFTAGMSGIALLPESQRPTILGLNSFVGGGICLPLFPLVGALAQTSWRAAFPTHLVLLPTILFALALPAGRTQGAATNGAVPVRRGVLAGVPVVLAVITTCAGLAMVSSSMYSPFLLASIGITEPSQIGQILAVMSLCSLAGSGSYGFVHRRFGTASLLKAGLALMSLGCLVIGLAPGLPVAMAGMGLLGMGLAVFAASAYATAIDSVGPTGNAPSAMGVMTLCLYGSQMAFPFITGSLGVASGPASVFLLIAALMALSLALFLIPGARPNLGEAA